MDVDDHAIDSLKVWYNLAIKELRAEHQRNLSEPISKLPSFKAAKAYEKAINVLINAYYLPEFQERYRLPSAIKLIKEEDELRKIFGDKFTPVDY